MNTSLFRRKNPGRVPPPVRIPLFDGAASAPDNKTQKQAADAPAKPDILVLCGWQGCTLARGSGRPASATAW